MIYFGAKKDFFRLPARIPLRALAPGPAILKARITIVFCREDNTGVCRIKTFLWRAPVEVVSDPTAPNEINLSSKISGD
jgi:hypothetical protein